MGFSRTLYYSIKLVLTHFILIKNLKLIKKLLKVIFNKINQNKPLFKPNKDF